MNASKTAPKKLMAKATAKPSPAGKVKARRQMTVALAEKYAFRSKGGQKIDSVAFLRTLR
jgi:hypothetical protein